MSYILEALKKAQAERQLGNAPTIHAPTIHHAPARLATVNRTGAVAAGICVVVVVAAGWYAWSQHAPAPAAVLTPAPVVVTPAPAIATPAPVSVPVPVAVPAPVAVGPAPVAVPRTEPVVRVRKAVPAPVPAAPPAPSPEDNIRFAKDLPQDIQQQLPHVTFGGYMYSDNAADRLVLVDKTLRHENEEIAPGLMLEKLLPRGAVLNFRGTRYRVGF